jgi:Tfp pilus assembly protein PilO
LGLIAAGGAFFLFTQPTYDKVKAANVEIASYDAALQKAAELQARKQELLSRFNAFNSEDRARLEKLLPDHVDNVRLILDLDNLATRHNMALQNVVVAGASGAPAAQTAIGAVGASKQRHDSLTLTFTTQATYEDFLAFLGDLELSLRIVDLSSLKISPLANEGGGAPRYSFNITIRTYWLK